MMPPLQAALYIADSAGRITRDFKRWLDRLAQNNGIDNDMLRDSAALSVIGRSDDTAGDPGDIAGAAGEVLRVSDDGATLGFGSINASSVTGLQSLVEDDVRDLLAYALNRIAFLEQALKIAHTERDLPAPAALSLLEDRIQWM